jgi:hypothetical protein
MALPPSAVAETPSPAEPPLAAAAAPRLLPGRIDKSRLALAEPKRLRDKAHLQFVAAQPCLICGQQPCDPHHLRFAQPRALGLKVSDEFTVPLCRGHHRQLHQAGNEMAWWKECKIEPLPMAKALWQQTRSKPGRRSTPSKPMMPQMPRAKSRTSTSQRRPPKSFSVSTAPDCRQ